MLARSYRAPRSRGLSLTLLTALILLAARPSRSAEERVVWTSDRSGNFDIWSMRPDGSDKRQLTHDPASDMGPMLSPDGRSLLFQSRRSGTLEIWVLDLTTEDATPYQVTSSGHEAHDAVWDAGSESFWFTEQDPADAQWYLRRIRVDGTGVEWITDPATGARLRGYSNGTNHAGSRLVHMPQPNSNPNTYDVWVANADGSNPVNASAANGLTGYERSANKLPLSSTGWVLFSGQEPSWRSTTDYRIWKLHVGGGGAEPVLDLSGSRLGEPGWSIDETQIVFSGLIGTPDANIHVMDANGESRVQLTEDPGKDVSPHWGIVATVFDPPVDPVDDVRYVVSVEGEELVVGLEADVATVGGSLCLVVDPGRVEISEPLVGADLPEGARIYRSPRAYDDAGEEVPGGLILGWLTGEPGGPRLPEVAAGSHEILRLPIRAIAGACDEEIGFDVLLPGGLRSGADNPIQSSVATTASGETVPADAITSGELRVLDTSGCTGLVLDTGWEDGPERLEGAPGEPIRFSVLATLTGSGNEGESGPQGYTLAVGAESACIRGMSLEGTDAGDLFDAGFEQYVPCDAGGSDCEGEGTQCAVYAVILAMTTPVSLAANGTASVARVDLVTSAPGVVGTCRDGRVTFLPSLTVPPNPEAETSVSLGDRTIYPKRFAEHWFQVCAVVDVAFRRGDVDADSKHNITDAVRILNFLFSGGEKPSCMDAADVTDDGKINITDAVALLGYLFLGGDAPAPPGPASCGVDTTADPLDCKAYDGC